MTKGACCLVTVLKNLPREGCTMLRYWIKRDILHFKDSFVIKKTIMPMFSPTNELIGSDFTTQK